MKQVITPVYTFTPASKTLNLSGIAGFDIRKLYAVINVTRGAIIYQTNGGTTNGATVVGTTLTLAFDTTAHNAADLLTIIYDVGSTFPAGFTRVSDEPTQLFYDPFDTLDAVDRWTAASAGGGVGAAVATGNLTLGTGTTANGYATAISKPTFAPPIPGWLGVSFAISLENPVTANTYRFWGIGQKTGTPTAAAPLTDAIGFELATDGKLYAVVYKGGTRSVVQDLSAATGNGKQPADALGHRYILYYRTDRSFWYIDGLDSHVASASFVTPDVQTLPIQFAAIAGSVAPASSGILTVLGIASWDTAKNNKTISDGTFGWRKAKVTAAGALRTQDIKEGTGRALVSIVYSLTSPAIADTLVSGIKTTAGVAAAAAATHAAAAGKTLRITGVTISTRTTTAAVPFGTVRLRMNPTGAAVIGSPVIAEVGVGGSAAVAGNTGNTNFPILEGLEISGTQQIGVSLSNNVATNVVSITLTGYEY